LCKRNQSTLNQLRRFYFENLQMELNTQLEDNNLYISTWYLIFSIEDIDWSTNITNQKFNLIDLIKGIIPLSLSTLVNNITKNRKLTKSIIYNHRQTFVSKLNIYWKEHCNLTKVF
jgi:hypothetical protein